LKKSNIPLFLLKINMMNALVLRAKDQPLAYEQVAIPIATEGEILVKLKAAALNHRDVWIQKGLYAGIKYPTILGSDGAGLTTDNQEVILNPSMNWGENPRAQSKAYTILGLPTDGTFAEYVKVPQSAVFPKPTHLSFVEAAALPLAGLTAYRALFSQGQAQKGDKILITGIGGGVALFALQFALAAGCEVWVTSGSGAKLQAAIALGANGGISYKQDNWTKDLVAMSGGFDVIIDSAVSDSFADMVHHCTNPGARVVFYGATSLGTIDRIKPAIIFWKQLALIGSTMGNDAEFAKMLEFVSAKKIIPHVNEVFSLRDGNAAMEKMNEGKQFGKLVLEC
jgi:zinc-binding alcohol dehydrogenase/oxidoreductase